ncbi:unnamed protein product [Amoebophrya sp. A120]|nr:unnamed protein product [Amoebophrya sp. A120]|eukprot:GSA120T00023824001.1
MLAVHGKPCILSDPDHIFACDTSWSVFLARTTFLWFFLAGGAVVTDVRAVLMQPAGQGQEVGEPSLGAQEATRPRWRCCRRRNLPAAAASATTDKAAGAAPLLGGVADGLGTDTRSDEDPPAASSSSPRGRAAARSSSRRARAGSASASTGEAAGDAPQAPPRSRSRGPTRSPSPAKTSSLPPALGDAASASNAAAGYALGGAGTARVKVLKSNGPLGIIQSHLMNEDPGHYLMNLFKLTFSGLQSQLPRDETMWFDNRMCSLTEIRDEVFESWKTADSNRPGVWKVPRVTLGQEAGVWWDLFFHDPWSDARVFKAVSRGFPDLTAGTKSPNVISSAFASFFKEKVFPLSRKFMSLADDDEQKALSLAFVDAFAGALERPGATTKHAVSFWSSQVDTEYGGKVENKFEVSYGGRSGLPREQLTTFKPHYGGAEHLDGVAMKAGNVDLDEKQAESFGARGWGYSSSLDDENELLLRRPGDTTLVSQGCLCVGVDEETRKLPLCALLARRSSYALMELTITRAEHYGDTHATKYELKINIRVFFRPTKEFGGLDRTDLEEECGRLPW